MADVRLAEVSKWFGGVRAVDALSLEVAQGEFLSLLGPSGCGKTTVLRLIAGFLDPTAGEIFIRGRSMARVPPFRRSIGMVFQNYSLFPHLNVYDNVAFGLRIRKIGHRTLHEAVTEALKLVRLEGIEAVERRFPHELSGGQQQRVALARALVIRPEVLLLDEPFGALDKKLREQMQLELKGLQREIGITTIFVTHDQEEALILSDRVAVMRAGRIEHLGPPAEIYERPRTRFAADFIGRSNSFQGRVVRDAGPGALLHTDEGLAIKVPEELPEGPAEVLLRPEQIAISATAPTSGADTVVAGTVADVMYLGTHVKYDVRIGTKLVEVFEQNVGGGPKGRYAPGDRVVLSWRSADLLCPRE
ncbi:MAG: ABC transporter ATP-binding protein [Deltaproteobacteria bacterium]|nr:ABC transporter ATP-binding protein [Deltaproteobacteria bacterium]MBI3076048.1 ABC transporter ATP-binding protein [Deltaproteobacteria bacterium]